MDNEAFLREIDRICLWFGYLLLLFLMAVTLFLCKKVRQLSDLVQPCAQCAIHQ